MSPEKFRDVRETGSRSLLFKVFPIFPANDLKIVNIKAEISSVCNLEKLKPEDNPGAVVKNESEIGKWTVEK